MAHQKFSICLAGIGNYVPLHQALERALNKQFSPASYEIVVLQFNDVTLKSVVSDIERLKQAGEYPLDLRDFADLEARAVLGFKTHPQCHCSVVVESNRTPSFSVGMGVQSHYGVRALLLENHRPKDWSTLLQKRPDFGAYGSRLEMPYFGHSGSTQEQVDKAIRTALKFLIEGWKYASLRRDGILSSIDRAA